MPVPSTFAAARSTLKSKRADTATALVGRATAQQNLDAALRLGDATAIANAQAAFNSASSALTAARTAETGARSALNTLITNWLNDTSTPPNPLTPDADFARLDVAGVPIALFPVRLETRFDTTAATLHIRVYPDEFFSDIHERELTADELAAGQGYWDAVNQTPDGEETADLWAPVAKRYGVPRAAYIVNLTDPSQENLVIPRATVPSRAAEAVLPDRWVALAFKGGSLRHVQSGKPIPEPIELTPNPSADDQTMAVVADGFTVPSNILWTMSYPEALAKGMAIDISGLASDELQTGFDRVVVLGVKTSMDPLSASQLIADLFDAHHYTRGLDLVPLGTPTNNIPGQPTPFTMKDPSAEVSFQVERIGPPGFDSKPHLDFVALSDLFGYQYADGPFTFLSGAVNLQQDISTGQDMRAAIWPATLGYFMRQMMNPKGFLNGNAAPIFSEPTFANAKAFFNQYVSAQGPAPAFRVGAVPYGLLPAISYSRMQAQTNENADAMEVIRKLVPLWQAAAATVPVVSQSSTDRNTDLMKVLSQKSSSDGVFVRNSLGPDTVANLYQWVLQDLGAYFTAMAQLPASTLGSLGHPDWSTARIFELLFSKAITQFAGPLVTAHPLQGMLVSAVNPTPSSDPTTFNYLLYLGSSALPLSLVQDQGAMPNVAPPGELIPLLYLVARHSLLLEMMEAARASTSTLVQQVFGTTTNPIIRAIDFELWGITATADPKDAIAALGTVPTGSSHTIFQMIQSNSDFAGHSVDSLFRYSNIADALGRLSDLPVAELERVFTETMDLAAHRLDAYVTGFGTRRLSNFRGTTAGNQTYLGGYGVVENVRPVTRTTRQIPGVGTASVQADNGGYIHAPSLRHATTAAILRSGRMAEKSDPTKYAIELPSDRARQARLLVDGVRDGQSLGELLGFQLESGLRASGVTNIEVYIQALRQLYPLVANKSGLDPGQPADGIAAANVVDGQLVRQAAAAPSGLPFGTSGLPAPNTAGQQAISAQVQLLNGTVDAIGDLEMSEAIFQIAAGDVASAEAAMNFLPDGANPPQSEVTTSPTAGIPVNHRVALLLEGTALPAAPGWTLGATPRGKADAFAEAWVGSLLGNPTTATAQLTYQLNGPQTGSVAVADMKTIGPLDFLALAQSTSVAGQGSPLDRQLAAAFAAKTAGATSIAITTYDTPSGLGISQLIELARALGAVLGGARELAAADLVFTPDDVDQSTLAATATALAAQASAAVTALQAALAAFGTQDARTALVGASAYQAEAFPDPSASDADLAVQVMNAQGELGRRLTDAQAAAPATGAISADTISAAINQLRIVFGRNTLVVLPEAVPPGAGELGQSLSALDRPLNINDATTFDAHQAPGRYLQQATRVHDRLAAWRRFGLYAGARGTASPRVSVAQLPFMAGEDWAGRSAPSDSRTSLLFVSANGQTALPDPTQTWRGLSLDQWTEIVPAATTDTGLAFHYDSQNSEAPQVILMAIQSGQPGNWSLTELQTIINETLDLAQIRPVDSDLVALGQLVPPICLASNPQNLVVSTNIGPNSRQDVPIVVT